VGCDLRRFDLVTDCRSATADPPLILWNQRWEYDKDPNTFFRALYALADEGTAFRLALAGANVRQMPEEFDAARKRLGARVVHYGRADEAAYARLLRQADVVVSTALHEFFGVAVVEAIYCGCFPVLPRRLTYPELVPPQHDAVCLYEDFRGLVARLRWALTHLDEARATAAALCHTVGRFDWSKLALRYDTALEALQTLPDDRGW
jgi:glycosyltransferase involved in cell wall biosynthesis